MSDMEKCLSKFKRVPIDRLKTPFEGAVVMLNRYWLKTEDSEVLFFGSSHAPQCNADLDVALVMASKRGLGVEKIPVAYVPDLSFPPAVAEFFTGCPF